MSDICSFKYDEIRLLKLAINKIILIFAIFFYLSLCIYFLEKIHK